MKLYYIYVLLGISTLALNLALTLHLFRGNKNEKCQEANEGNEIITFRLTRGHNTEEGTTMAVPYDDTASIERQ